MRYLLIGYINRTLYINYIDCLLIALSIADRYGPDRAGRPAGPAPCAGAAGPSVRGAGGAVRRGAPQRGPSRGAVRPRGPGGRPPRGPSERA